MNQTSQSKPAFFNLTDSVEAGKPSRNFIFYDAFYEDLVARCRERGKCQNPEPGQTLNFLTHITRNTTDSSTPPSKKSNRFVEIEQTGEEEMPPLVHSPISERLNETLVQLPRPRDYRELELKYLNAVRLVDELNWQLNPPS